MEKLEALILAEGRAPDGLELLRENYPKKELTEIPRQSLSDERIADMGLRIMPNCEGKALVSGVRFT